jgi:hypothetical protein
MNKILKKNIALKLAPVTKRKVRSKFGLYFSQVRPATYRTAHTLQGAYTKTQIQSMRSETSTVFYSNP